MHSAKKLVDLPGTFRDLENTLQIEKYQLNLFKPYVKHIYLVRLDKLNLSEGISLSGNKLFKLLPLYSRFAFLLITEKLISVG